MIDLKALAGDRYKTALDESAEIPGQSMEDRAWLVQVPGESGHIYIHGHETLGVYVRTFNDGSRKLDRLLALTGAKLHQRGDKEATVTLPADQFEAAASIIHARVKRKLSEEHKQKLAQSGLSHRFRPGSQGER